MSNDDNQITMLWQPFSPWIMCCFAFFFLFVMQHYFVRNELKLKSLKQKKKNIHIFCNRLTRREFQSVTNYLYINGKPNPEVEYLICQLNLYSIFVFEILSKQSVVVTFTRTQSNIYIYYYLSSWVFNIILDLLFTFHYITHFS